jgi:hypothetical protein
MAYIQPDDKLLDQQNAQGAQTPGLVGDSAGQDVGNGVSTAGVGAGGMGNWTNIQAYLGANKGDTGSAQALDKTVNSQFDTEKKTMADQSQNFLSGAQKQVDDSKVSNEQADNLIKSAADSYSWQGEQPTAYKDSVGKVQGALNKEYSGPLSYDYGFTAPTQQYGQDLKDNGGFDNLMSSIYSKAAGSPLTSGQYALQKQLDVNNEGLSNTREKLLGQYAGLEGERDNTVQNTTKSLSGLAEQYRNNQSALRDYLGRTQNDYDTKIAQAEADARAAYNNDYTQGKSGMSSIGTGVFGDKSADWRSSQNILGDNLTWDQLQREYNYKDPGSGAYDSGMGLWVGGDPAGNGWEQRNGALNNFYTSEDQKYANTGDQEERTYNAILDFLGQTGNKKQQGFKVRG